MSVADVEAVARAAHAGQTDKAGRPYAEHLAAVAEGVRARGGGDELVAAAWLHDAVEDGVLDEEWLEAAALPQRTKDVVRAVTKRPGEEPEAYARRILATPGARLVKAADLAHNADPRRLAVLDAPTARRLAAKYAAMRRHLGLTADDRPATTDQPRPTTGERPPATDHRQAAADEPALTTDQ
jgi:(p)ppGpp synthase/HD superfamily hydrolase